MLRTVCRTTLLLASLACPNLVAGAPGASNVEQRIHRIFPGVLHPPNTKTAFGAAWASTGRRVVEHPTARLAVANELKPSRQVVLGEELSGFAVSSEPKSSPVPAGRKPEEQRAWEAFTRRSASAGSLHVFLPGTYSQPFVAELGGQRVVLKALGAGPAPATAGRGLVAYENAYEGVDSLSLIRDSGSEEFLLVREETCRRSFEYEVLEQKGIAEIVVRDGKVRFVGMGVGPEIQLDQPWLIDAGGKKSKTAVAWEIAKSSENGPARLQLRWKGDGLKYPILIDPSFISTGSLTTARYWHTATLLPSGKVLIVGGNLDVPVSNVPVTSAELYDPASGTFTATGSLATARYGHTATLLPSGKVLVVGGYNGGYLSSAELYDPTSGTFTATGSLATARGYHTATLLSSGKVLVVGGYNGSYLSSAELYDPDSGIFTPTGSLATARAQHTATLLSSGKVLVVGGYNGSYLSSAELYDPASGIFMATGSLATARAQHTATLLPSGKVLVSGDYDSFDELYDPASGTFTATDSPATLRLSHTATLLPSGEVLVAGGYNPFGVLSSAELYDPASGTFSATGFLITARYGHTATLLPSGKVLAAGGYGSYLGSGLSSAELYDPTSGAFTPTGFLITARYGHSATLLPSGKVLVAGGSNGSLLSSAELYDPASGTFTPTGSLATAREAHSATLLPSGKVLIAGGSNGSAELYDPTSGTFTATGSLATARFLHTATLLPSGKVLVAGGLFESAIRSAELYDPASGIFTGTGSLATARFYHTATLLPSGKVLVAGGLSGGWVSSAELYDPASGTFTATGSLATARGRAAHTATLLPSGKVLVAGGNDGVLSTAELYDPASGTFTATGSPTTTTPFLWSTATLLPSGKVLVAGGVDSNDSLLSSAELYDEGLGYQGTWRPVISSVTSLPNQASQVVASGTLFTGLNGNGPEASGGGAQSSPTNYPLLQLRRIDNEETVFLPLDPTSGFTATSFTSGTAWVVNPGPAIATVFTNSIPSVAKPVLVSCGVSIAVQPQNQTVRLGDPATFGVTALAAFSYQWQKDVTGGGAWTDIAGATGPTYTTPPITGADSGTAYRVVVKGNCASVTSSPAIVTVADSTPPVASLVSPTGGEFWLLSTTGNPPNTKVVTWSMSDNVRICRVAVSLLYSNDGGTNYTPAPAGGGLPATFGPGGSCLFPGETTTSLTYTVPTTFPSGKSGSLYKIQVVVTDGAGNVTTVFSPNPFYIVAGNPDVKTLFVSNVSRMVTKQGISSAQGMLLAGKLQELAGHPRVQGLVLDLAGVPAITALYSAWDADSSNPDKANAVLFGTNGIHDYLRSILLTAYSGVKYLVLVGDDRIIPMARVSDHTALLPESTYTSGGGLTPDRTTVGQALHANRYLSDDPLGVMDGLTPDQLSGVVYTPDLELGRLVESPEEITKTIATFISQDGVLDLTALDAMAGHKVLVTGYDFLENAATQVRARWKAALGDVSGTGSLAPVDGSLISKDWGSGSVGARVSALRTHLSGNGGSRYGVMAVLGHATHEAEGVPGTNPQDIVGLSTADIYGTDECATASQGPLDLSGGVIYAVGCHGGLPVPGTCRTDADHSLDLPQTMMSRGAVVYIANSGYGWGLKFGIGYGARLAQLMTEQMTSGGTVVVGDAVKKTKQRYVLETPRFDPYDEKSVMEWTLYGLPMYAIKTGIPSGGSSTIQTQGKHSLGPIKVTRGDSSKVRALSAKTLPPFLTQVNLHFDFTAPNVYTKHDSLGNVLSPGPGCTDPNGCYYTLNGLVDRGTGAGDLPIQPYFIYDSRLSGTSQHGSIWKGGTYDEDKNFRPVFGQLVSNAPDNTDHGSIGRMIYIRPTVPRLVPGVDPSNCRPSDLELNSLTVSTAEALKVNDTDTTYQIERLHRGVDLEVLYFNDTQTPGNDCDRAGPSIRPGTFGGLYHQVNSGTIQWSVPVNDASGVWRVIVVYNDNSVDAQGRGHWTPLELTDSTPAQPINADHIFTGSVTISGSPLVTYVLQAVDNRGNVTWLDYVAARLPASGVPLGIPQAVDVTLSPTRPQVLPPFSPARRPRVLPPR